MLSTVDDHYREFLATHYTWMCGGHELQVEMNRNMLIQFGLGAYAGGKALDLGCGSGFQSLALAALGLSVVAVDTNQQLLDELTSFAADKSITAIRGNMLCCETYASHAPFDAVVCMGDTLTHAESLEQVEQLFQDTFAHMRPGGRMLLTFRDLSSELEGIDRAIPVRLDEDGLMATFLEFSDTKVNVHDLLFTRKGGEWRMTKSAYQKLRLPGDKVVAMLAQAGFVEVDIVFDRGFAIISAEKPAP